MDTLTFIKDIVDKLCWPLTLIIIAGLFKKPLSKLISKIIELKLKKTADGFELSIGADVSKVMSKLPDGENLKKPALDGTKSDAVSKAAPEDDLNLAPVISASPNAAVLTSWSMVKKEMKNVLSRVGDGAKPSSSVNAIVMLKDKNLIDADTAEALHGLVDIKNTVAHLQEVSGQVTAAGAKEYGLAAQKAIRVLKAL